MEQSDYDYALSLHFMLNGESAIDRVKEGATALAEEEESSDDEIFEEIQAKRQKTSADEYYVPSIKTWIELLSSTDWSEVHLTKCNIQMIFDKMKDYYFGQWLTKVNCVVKWDQLDVISDGSSFKILKESSGYVAYVAMNMLIRPRIQLMSIILHILIHLYLTASSQTATTLNKHDQAFRKIMHFFNSRIETKITTGHNFFYASDENQYQNQWWQCTGICINYQPFYGVIRCSSMPSEAMYFWTKHHLKCGGTFFKIFEAERQMGDGSIEKKFVRNVKYLNPRAKNDDTPPKKGQVKTFKATQSLQVRAQIDLTEEEPQEKNLCTVINLDESEFVFEETDDDVHCAESEQIIKFVDRILAKCFLCQEIVGESRLASHFDSCTGFQQQVSFNPKKL